ncbi:unnamed protein product [Tilletia controversa]|nr:unnamed protein product [Tilletia controversa]
MSTSTAHTERPPTVTSIPPILVSQAQTIQSAYVNSGRMSEGLARLQSTKVMFQQAAKRNSTAAEQTEGAVSALLVAMQTDVRRRIKHSEARMSDELDGVKMRLRKEMACNHETIERHLQDTIKMVRSVMERTRDDAQGGLTDALDFLNICGLRLQEGINNTEHDYMGSLAQILVSNAWTTAWPEAIRTVQQVQQGTNVPPPQYGDDGRPVDADNRETTVSSANDEMAT